MKRFVLPLWLLSLATVGLLAVDVAESGSQPVSPHSARPDLALVDALVVRTLEIADESDQLLRARSSAAVAQALADAVQRAAKHGDTAQAAKLKVWLTAVLDAGIRSNLDTVDAAALAGARKALYEDLNERPDDISGRLETSLQDLNPPLKQALADADKKENERDKFKGWDKGRGPPKGKEKGKGKMPPPPWGDDKGWDKGKPGPPPWGDDKGWDKGKDRKGKKDQVGLPSRGISACALEPWRPRGAKVAAKTEPEELAKRTEPEA